MKFDPKALPFWEQDRGGGPVSDWMAARHRIEARARLKEVSEEIRSIRSTGEVTMARRNLPALEAEREALRAELGHLRLVREVA